MIAITDSHVHELNLIGGILLGGGGARFLIYLAKQLPALPPNASFFATFAYNIVKGASGLDPNSRILTPAMMQSLPVALSRQVEQTVAAAKDS